MEIMKIGGILLLVALALWIIKSLFDWWGEHRDSKKWWEQYKTKTSSWDERRGELDSEITKARMTMHVGDENSVVRGVLYSRRCSSLVSLGVLSLIA